MNIKKHYVLIEIHGLERRECYKQIIPYPHSFYGGSFIVRVEDIAKIVLESKTAEELYKKLRDLHMRLEESSRDVIYFGRKGNVFDWMFTLEN